MEWGTILALVLAIPVILFPAAYVGYLTIGGVLGGKREAARREAGAVHGHALAG